MVTRTPVPTEFLGAVKAEMTGPRAPQKYSLRFHELSMRPVILKAHARLRRAAGVAPLRGSELRKRFVERAKALLGESLAAAVAESDGRDGAASMALSKETGWKDRSPAGTDFVPMVERSLRYIRNTTIDSSIIFRFNRLLDPPAEPDLVEYVVQKPETREARGARLDREKDAAYASVGRLDVIGDGIRVYEGIARDRPAAGKSVRFFKHLRQHPDDPDTRHPERRPLKSGVLPVTGTFALESEPHNLLEDDDSDYSTEDDEDIAASGRHSPAAAAAASSAAARGERFAPRSAPRHRKRPPQAPSRRGSSQAPASSAAARAQRTMEEGAAST
jgi:hypothetical protein